MAAALRSYESPSAGGTSARMAEGAARPQTIAQPGPSKGGRGVKRSSSWLRSLPADRHLHAIPAPPAPSPVVKLLSRLQVGSAVLATVAVGLALGSYAYSVGVDRQLNRATSRLSQLQRNQQQLTTANEVLKSHLANQAEQPSAGLQPPNPNNVIFLKPVLPAPAEPKPSASPVPRIPDVFKPLGY